jgi:hypothetical protein
LQVQLGENWLWLAQDMLPSWQCPVFIWPDAELGEVMTVVGEFYVLFCIQLIWTLLISSSEEINDARAALERRNQRLAEERRAERIAALKGGFIRVGNWIAKPFRTAAIFKKLAVQAVLIQTDHCPVCVHLSRCVGGMHSKLLDGIIKIYKS